MRPTNEPDQSPSMRPLTERLGRVLGWRSEEIDGCRGSPPPTRTLEFGSSSTIITASMASITNSSAGCSLKQSDQCCLGSIGLTNLSLRSNQAGRSRLCSTKKLAIRAEYSERSTGSNLFVSGFVLGSIIVGALGCIYAPQISQAISGTDKKDLMRKLPKFIYDEEKALERKRKKLTEKIAQLDTAIDGVSAQLRSDDAVDDDLEQSEEVEVTA